MGAKDNGQFGTSLSLSSDGQTLLIGSQYFDLDADDNGTSRDGMVAVFKKSESGWNQFDENINGSEDSNFGQSVSISGDASTIIIGEGNAENGGNVYIYNISSTETGGTPDSASTEGTTGSNSGGESKAATAQAIAGSLSNSITNSDDINVVLSTYIYSVSAAEAGDLSQALTFNDGAQTLNKYIKTNGAISTDVTSNNSAADVFAVKQENAADGDNYYVLDVDAKANGDYNINSYDISLGYDKDLFEVLDVGINGEFNFFNSAAIDSDNGTLRVVGGSAENLADWFCGGL